MAGYGARADGERLGCALAPRPAASSQLATALHLGCTRALQHDSWLRHSAPARRRTAALASCSPFTPAPAHAGPPMSAPPPMNMASTMIDAKSLSEMTPPFIATEGVEYTPLRAPKDGPKVEDLGSGSTVKTATECAMKCSQNKACNMATYITLKTWPEPENCYLKTIEEPCVVPSEALSLDGFYLLMAQTPGCARPPAAPALRARCLAALDSLQCA
jgi:hypothetical protein